MAVVQNTFSRRHLHHHREAVKVGYLARTEQLLPFYCLELSSAVEGDSEFHQRSLQEFR